MEARMFRAAWIVAALLSLGAGHRTRNFIVTAASPQLAAEIGETAERMRRDLALEWLGQELPDWQDPCSVTANVSPQLGAGGATSFMFNNRQPFGWTMTIQGSRERVLDSVLPHEITHTVFATHFGQPLPRWADEGGCTTVEHESERRKQQNMLITFLTTERGIPFNDMFAMRQYPKDIMPLYSQGYSLARYLIAQGGKRKYVQYIGDGLQWNNWTAATQKHYGFRSLSDLQVQWLEWVRQGSPDQIAQQTPAAQPLSPATQPVAVEQAEGPSQDQLAAAGPDRQLTSSAASNSPYRPGSTGKAAASLPRPLAPVADIAVLPFDRKTLRTLPHAPATAAAAGEYAATSGTPAPAAADPSAAGWYARQRDQAVTQQATRQAISRPQAPTQAGQVVLDWGQPAPDNRHVPVRQASSRSLLVR